MLSSWPIWANIVFYDFGKGVPHIDLLRVSVILLFLTTFLVKLLTLHQIKLDWPLFIFIIYLSYIFAHIFHFAPSKAVMGNLAIMFDLYFIPMLFYFILLNNWEESKSVSYVYCFLFSGLLISLASITEFFAAKNLFGQENIYSTEKVAGMTLIRPNGLFYDVITNSGICLLYIPLINTFIKKKIIKPYIGYSSIILMAGGCLVAFSRATLLGLLFITIVIFTGGKLTKNLLMVYGIALLGVIGYATYESISSTPFYRGRIGQTETIITRWNQFLHVLKIFSENILFGIGYGAYFNKYKLHIHNSFLRILVEFGLIGFGFYIAGLLSLLIKKASSSMGERDPHILKARIGIGVVVFLVGSTIDLLGNKDFFFPFIVAVSLLRVKQRVI